MFSPWLPSLEDLRLYELLSPQGVLCMLTLEFTPTSGHPVAESYYGSLVESLLL